MFETIYFYRGRCTAFGSGHDYSVLHKSAGCKNTSEISEESTWSDPAAMQLLVNYIYSITEPDNFNNGFSNYGGFRYYQGNIADEGRPSAEFLGRTNGINNGVAFRVENSPFQLWIYGPIRQCNDFLEKINSLYVLPPGTPQSKIDERNVLIGQVRFFRAFCYWKMVQVYGGIPIVDKVLNENSPELYDSRNTQDECFAFIKKELEEAAGLLPVNYPAANRGMITKGAALGLLSRVLIFRASPLYNTNNNQQYWQDASDAAKALLDLNAYSITGVTFGNWFFEKSNPETIWQIEFVKGKKEHGWDAANHPNYSWAQGDAVATCPTQELVDAFPMLNGKPISDITSGYNPANPYAGRDPRLKATVITNGDLLGGVPIWSYISEGSNTAGNYKYNANGIGMSYATSTGYYLRKAMDERILVTRDYNFGRGSYSNWVEMRMGEIMLNYAEAENELGNQTPAYDMLKALRQRAGLTAGVDGNYGIPAGLTTSQMRSVLQNERLIELAFENKRYWDLRRWKLAETVLAQPTHSVRITKLANTPPSTNGTDYSYTFVVNQNDITFPPVFQQKFYFLPLPKEQLLLNSNLEQNPLW